MYQDNHDDTTEVARTQPSVVSSGEPTRGVGSPGSPSRASSRWLAIGLAALAVLSVVELAFRVAEPHLPRPEEWASVLMRDKINQMDERRSAGLTGGVVITGSSQAWMIDPLVLEEWGVSDRTYNASLNGATLAAQTRWLTEEVAPRLEPDTVVLGMSIIDRSAVVTSLVPSYEEARATTRSRLGSLDRWMSRRFAFFRLRPLFADLAASYQSVTGEGRMREPILLGKNGNIVAAVDSTLGKLERPGGSIANWRPDDEAHFESDLRKLAVELKSTGVRLLVVLLPVAEVSIDALPGGRTTYEAENRKTVDAVKRLATELESSDEGRASIEVIDLTQTFAADSSFRDPVHLSTMGGLRATEVIAAHLGGTEPSHPEPVLLDAFPGDRSSGGIKSVSLVRPGWLEVTLSDTAMKVRPYHLDVITGDGDQRERVRLTLNPSRDIAVFSRMGKDGWEEETGVRLRLVEDGTLQFEVPHIERLMADKYRGEVSVRLEVIQPGAAKGRVVLDPIQIDAGLGDSRS